MAEIKILGNPLLQMNNRELDKTLLKIFKIGMTVLGLLKSGKVRLRQIYRET